MDWKLELVAVPVSDVDRAKVFYTQKVGLHADHDQQVNEKLRFVQLTPPGSACSEGLQMVVPDIEAAHQQLAGRGVEVSAVEDLSWGRFVYFSVQMATNGRYKNCPSGIKSKGQRAV